MQLPFPSPKFAFSCIPTLASTLAINPMVEVQAISSLNYQSPQRRLKDNLKYKI
jgi:hypothetical protein